MSKGSAVFNVTPEASRTSRPQARRRRLRREPRRSSTRTATGSAPLMRASRRAEPARRAPRDPVVADRRGGVSQRLDREPSEAAADAHPLGTGAEAPRAREVGDGENLDRAWNRRAAA